MSFYLYHNVILNIIINTIYRVIHEPEIMVGIMQLFQQQTRYAIIVYTIIMNISNKSHSGITYLIK